jgi:hypothetical protein
MGAPAELGSNDDDMAIIGDACGATDSEDG